MGAKNFFNEVISIINEDNNKNYANTLKKGDLVYVQYGKTIMQAKVLSLQTIFSLRGVVNCLVATTSFVLLLANGDKYDSAKHEHPITLHKSVEDVRRNNNGFIRVVEADLATTQLFNQLVYRHYGLETQDCFIFYVACSSPYRIGMRNMGYYHNDGEVYLLDKYHTDLNHKTIKELAEYGLYTSYADAYNSYQPQVLCFEDEVEAIKEEPQTINIQISAKGSKENIANMISKLAKENNIEVKTI